MEAESAASASSEECGGEGSRETQVVLNVYDLTSINDYSYWFGVGIFHSGIEVHGMEYGYGAHDFPASGVFEVEPKCCPGFTYRCSISLGSTKMTQPELRTFIENLAYEYYGDTYHLISKNCNHFTDDLSRRLTGKRIPGWVNRLAWLGSVCSCLLPDSLKATVVKPMPDYVISEEDESESFSTPPVEATESDGADQNRHLLLPTATSEERALIKEGLAVRSSQATFSKLTANYY